MDNLKTTVKDTVQTTSSKAIKKLSTATDSVKDYFSQLASNPKTEKALQHTQEALLSMQVALKDMADNVAGKKMVEQAQALIEKQEKYNNVLATRLAEALDKIKVLEERLNKVEANHGRS